MSKVESWRLARQVVTSRLSVERLTDSAVARVEPRTLESAKKLQAKRLEALEQDPLAQSMMPQATAFVEAVAARESVLDEKSNFGSLRQALEITVLNDGNVSQKSFDDEEVEQTWRALLQSFEKGDLVTTFERLIDILSWVRGDLIYQEFTSVPPEPPGCIG